jgi:hypothetical protein
VADELAADIIGFMERAAGRPMSAHHTLTGS